MMNEGNDLGWRYFLQLLKPIFLPFSGICVIFFTLLCVLAIPFMRNVAYDVEQALADDLIIWLQNHLPPIESLKENPAAPTVLHILPKINPDIEAYILDASGKILIPLQVESDRSVPTGPLRAALNGDVPLRDTRGSDPRYPESEAYFLVRELIGARGSESGYLYLVVRSRSLRALSSLDGILNYCFQLFVRILPLLGCCLALGFLFAISTTRNFRKVLRLIRAFQGGDTSAVWKSRSNDDIQVLGETIEKIGKSALLRQQNIKLKESRRREMLLEIVHDVRNPLMGIQASAATLLREVRQKRNTLSKTAFRSLRAGIESLKTFSSALLRTSAFDMTSDQLQYSQFRAELLVEQVVGRLKVAAETKQINLLIQLHSKLPEISADRTCLERILVNLIDNALRHTQAGGKVEILLDASNEFLHISVCDSGVGIPGDELPHIFERFFRGSAQKLQQGAGVGLATVKKLVELHRGTIRVESQLGQGSIFKIKLPLSPICLSDLADHQQPEQRDVCAKSSRNWIAESLFLVSLVGCPISVIFLFSRQVSISLMIGYALLSLWIGFLFAQQDTIRERIILGLPFLLAYSWWWTETPRPHLTLAPIAAGFVLGSGFAMLIRSSGGRRSFLRLFYLCTIANTFSIGWTTFILHTLMEEEFSNFVKGVEHSYTQTLASVIGHHWCDSSSEQQIKSFQAIQALNRRQDVVLSSATGERLIGEDHQMLDVYSGTHSLIAGDIGSSLQRVLSFPRRRLAVQEWLPQCAPPVLMTVVFMGRMYDHAFRPSAHRNDLGFVFFACLIAALLFLLVQRKTSWPQDELLSAMKTVLLGGEVSHQHRADFTRLSEPILRPLNQLLREAEASQQIAEESDAELRQLSREAAKEYGKFADELDSLLLRNGLPSAESIGALPPEDLLFQLRRMESLIASEVSLTEALFEMTQPEKEHLSRQAPPVSLLEVLESLISQNLGVFDICSVVVRLEFEYDIKAKLDEKLLCCCLGALLQGIVNSIPMGSEVIISAEHANSYTTIHFNCSARESSDQSSPSIPQKPVLGLLVAEELCKRLGIQRQFSLGSGQALQEVRLSWGHSEA